MKTHINPDGTKISVANSVEIHPTARVGEGARVGEWASIGEGASVGEWARVGEGARVGARASVGEGASVGEWARVGEGASVAPRAQRRAVRSDGYVFTIAEREGVKMVFAGCREFAEKEAREHWNKNHPYGPETINILNFLFGAI